MIRCFFALPLPGAFYDEIRRVQGVLRSEPADVKWVRPEGVHLTIQFIGDAPEADIGPLAEGAGRAVRNLAPPVLTIEQAGVFPNARRPRVLWLGLGGDLDALAAIHRAVVQSSAALGYPPEDRPFTPHLTLGRVRSGQGMADLMTRLANLQPRPLVFTASELILYQSTLKPNGAVYTPLGRMKIEAAPH
jgi:2'-5' RNA ligase